MMEGFIDKGGYQSEVLKQVSRIMRVYFSNPVAHSLRTNKVSLQSVYPGQNILGYLRKLGAKTHFAKLTRILVLIKAG